MSAQPAPVALRRPKPTLAGRLSTFFYRHETLALLLMLSPPLLWLGVVYFGSLLALVIQSFFYLDDFTGLVVRQFSLQTYLKLLSAANLDIILRTVGMAATVTVACAVLAFPLAYTMARYASPKVKALLYLSVMLPLWSSYLIRVYSWKLILAKEGILNWFLVQLHLDGALNWLLSLPVIGGPSLSVSALGMFIVFVYIWLPYMVLPVHAALERVPLSLIEASGDLGARPIRTFAHVIFPLAFPGLVAGSIFTFSLTLGDYIIPGVIGDSSHFIGMTVYWLQGTSGNMPLAAAFTAVPMAIMGVYLIVARRLGAFHAL